MSDTPAQTSIRFGRFELRPAARQALAEGQPVRLGARAFDLLLTLVEARERCVGKDELLERVWPGLVVEENNLQVHVSALRKVFGASVISTIPGHGYRFTAELQQHEAASPSAASAASSASPVPRSLPQPRNRFIGREAELARCEALLEDVRLLTFSGMGGSGKTRLALELALRQSGRFDGVGFVDLAPLHEPGHVASAVAAALDVREEAGTPLVERLARRLGSERRWLIVLDNCEHVVGAVAPLADALLAACPGLKVLATSREHLGVAGEQVFPVRPLSLQSSDDLDLLRGSEAVRLFVDRAGLASPEFVFDERNAAAVGEICRRLDGIALAIELAAARVRMLSVAEIGLRLNDRFRFLTGGNRALPRHRTLEAALQWSYDSLAPAEQRLFRGLAVFAGGCTLAAAGHVAGETDDYVVLELLTRLHDKSLLVVDGSTPEPRYRMLETVRQYAQGRLEDDKKEADAARDRHLGHYAALAEQALREMQGPRQGAWMARLRLEQENVVAAHGWCRYATGGGEAGLRLVAALWRYWVASAQLELGYALAQAALAQAGETADAAWRWRALWAAGQIAFRMGRYDETLTFGDRCLALGRAVAGSEPIAAGLILRAGGLLATGQVALARPQFEEACSVARTLGASFALVAALHGLAEVHRALGQPGAAEACYEESIGAARALGDLRATALPLCNLAGLLVAQGRLERVRGLLQESLALATEAGLKGAGEHLLEVSAGLATALGDHRRAACFAGAALACMHEAGSRREPLHEAFVAPLMARARAQLGEVAFDTAKAEGEALSYEAAMGELRQWLAH